jgi:hypothetical protein
VHSRAMSGPVTIGDLKREGRLLEIGCMACNRHLYVDPAGAIPYVSREDSQLPGYMACI